jgi:hypothetical protein
MSALSAASTAIDGVCEGERQLAFHGTAGGGYSGAPRVGDHAWSENDALMNRPGRANDETIAIGFCCDDRCYW